MNATTHLLFLGQAGQLYLLDEDGLHKVGQDMAQDLRVEEVEVAQPVPVSLDEITNSQ